MAKVYTSNEMREIASLRSLVNWLADALWEENGYSYKKLIAKARDVANG